MRRPRFDVILGLTMLFACALIAAGCGGDDDDDEATTTNTSATAAAEEKVDAAVQSCSDEAQQLGGTAGTALESACTSVGDTANETLSTGGGDVKQALSQAESSCKSAVAQLPSGQAQDELTKLCDAIASAE
jgi:hypothetical protein